MKTILFCLFMFTQMIQASPLDCIEKAYSENKLGLNTEQLTTLFTQAGTDCSLPISCFEKSKKIFENCDSKMPLDVRAYLCSGTRTPDDTLSCFQNAQKSELALSCAEKAILCHGAKSSAPIFCAKSAYARMASRSMPTLSNENIVHLCSGTN